MALLCYFGGSEKIGKSAYLIFVSVVRTLDILAKFCLIDKIGKHLLTLGLCSHCTG